MATYDLGMRIQITSSEVLVDLITATVDIGQLAALSSKVGSAAIVEPSPEEPGHHVRVIQQKPADGVIALASLAQLIAYARGMSGNALLDALRAEFERRHFPLDKPIQDVMEIGGGPDHDGHEH